MKRRATLSRVRRRCRWVLDNLEPVHPFDARELCRQVGELRGREIVVTPLRLNSPALCGLWLGTATTDFIFHEADTSTLHRNHIVLHELGHVLCHQQNGVIDEDLLRGLFPALSPDLVRNALGRTRYSAVEEREAELFAHLVLDRFGQPPRAPSDEEADRVLRHITLGLDG